jgi:alpha-glucosidase
LAELASDDPEGAIAQYTAGEDRFHTAYAFRFLTKPFSASIIREGVEDLLHRAKDAWPSWAFSNHDFERVASRWGAGKPMPLFAKTLFMLVTSLRGTAFVYQGEELGLPQAELDFGDLRDPDGIAFWPAYKGRDGCRTPMPWAADEPSAGFTTGQPWLPTASSHRSLAVDLQERDPASMLHFVRKWLAFRGGLPLLRGGDIAFLEASEGLLVFDRFAGTERMRFFFNLGDVETGVALEPVWREVFTVGAERTASGATLPIGSALVLTNQPF